MYTNSSMSKTSQFLSGIVTVLILAALVLGCKPNVNNGTATAVLRWKKTKQ